MIGFNNLLKDKGSENLKLLRT